MAEKQSGVFIFTPFDRQAIELIKQAIKGKARGSSRSDFKSHLKIILRVIRAAMTRSGLPAGGEAPAECIPSGDSP